MNWFADSLFKINHGSTKLLFWLTALSSMVFFVVICLNVLVRYVLNTPILGSIEISRLSFVWSAFLASALAYRGKSHIAITFLLDRLPGQIQAFVKIIIYTVTWVFFLLLLFYSIEVTVALKNTYFPVMQISQTWLYLPLPFISIIILGYTTEDLLRSFQKKSE